MTPGNGGHVPPRPTGGKPNWTRGGDGAAAVNDAVEQAKARLKEVGVDPAVIKSLLGAAQKSQGFPTEKLVKLAAAATAALLNSYLGAWGVRRAWNRLFPDRAISYKDARRVVNLIAWGSFFAGRNLEAGRRSAERTLSASEDFAKAINE